jgi:hypothetical protein
MTQVYPTSIDPMAKVIFEVIDEDLDSYERQQAAQALFQHLLMLEVVPHSQLLFLRDGDEAERRFGVQATLSAEKVRLLLRGTADRLQQAPVAVRCFVLVGAVRMQVQTRYGDELLPLLPTIDVLLPARQLFQSRAEAYALRGGEHSPVEKANLELLRHRLDLSPEEANGIVERALGPYLDRQAKLQKYRDVLSAELSIQGHPLSEVTWDELRQLYQNLGLSAADVSGIEQEHLTRIQAEKTSLQQIEEETQMLEATRIAQQTAIEAQQTHQAHLNQYREEFLAAIAHSLYPNDFDRGRLEQARRLWHLDPAEVQTLEAAATAERYGPIDSELKVDYTRLRQLLWSGEWRAADEETERLILTGLSSDMRPISGDIFLQLPCQDLQTLEALWSRYSEGRFGFQKQYQIFQARDRRADEFLQAVDWRGAQGVGNLTVRTRAKRYRELQFSADAPPGHLPTWRWGCNTLESEYFISEALVDDLFLHVEKCLAPSSPDLTSPEQP